MVRDGGLKCCQFCLSGLKKDVVLMAVSISEMLLVSQRGQLYTELSRASLSMLFWCPKDKLET